MEFLRDRGTFFWNLLFPIILVVGFSFAFNGENDSLFKVGIIGKLDIGTASFIELESIEIIPYEGGREEVVEKIRRHQLDMLIDFNSEEFFLNTESSTAEILRLLGAGELEGFSERAVSGEPIRYVDWVVPGIIGMNMLFSCMFGVGFVIVRYRKNGVLKRIKATPVSPLVFISAQMASRFIIVLLTSVFVFTGTNFFFHFAMSGSYLLLLLVTAIAILCMISFGLIFAARLKSEELASGLMNLLTFPMIIFSGVFFSLEGTPAFMQTVSKIFPLTHFIEAARAVMIDGAGIVQIMPNILIMLGMTLAFLAIASSLFRWE
jgi:ABC-type multidrug transport system permease subunit